MTAHLTPPLPHLELRNGLREAKDLVGDLLRRGLAAGVVELDAPVLLCSEGGATAAPGHLGRVLSLARQMSPAALGSAEHCSAACRSSSNSSKQQQHSSSLHAPGPPGLWDADMMRPPYRPRRRMSADMAGVAMMASLPTTTCKGEGSSWAFGGCIGKWLWAVWGSRLLIWAFPDAGYAQ